MLHAKRLSFFAKSFRLYHKKACQVKEIQGLYEILPIILKIITSKRRQTLGVALSLPKIGADSEAGFCVAKVMITHLLFEKKQDQKPLKNGHSIWVQMGQG